MNGVRTAAAVEYVCSRAAQEVIVSSTAVLGIGAAGTWNDCHVVFLGMVDWVANSY